VQAQNIRFTIPARVKRVWFPLPDRLVPAYFVELVGGTPGQTTSDAYDYVIAADDGRLLYRVNLVHNDTFAYRVYADATGDHRPLDGPIVKWTPHPTGQPDGSYPAYTAPNLISIDGFNKFKDPWLPAGATVSTGNNVDAYTDDDSPDGFSGGSDIRATTTAPGVFDRTYDTSLGPQSSDYQRMASITDLFYVNNWLHDWWYDSGFDEAAGNAQQDNYGRGGVAGDPLHAEAQDGAPMQRNNSNMSAIADGESPRMQMFVWDGTGSSTLSVTPLNQSFGTGVADFGPQTFDVSGTVVLVDDGTSPNTDACQPITNNIAGKIALLDRGMCTFKQKVVNAQAAGAIGVILANNQAGGPPPMGDGNPPTAVTIPTLSVSLADGNALKAALQNGTVTATLQRTATVDRDGTIDNSVVAHEWGHYIHLRQVACGSSACGAESEGWGDTNALLMTVRQGDDLNGVYPLAVYATASFPDDPGYFGIRRYPYSADMTKNPLTFKHITSGEQLPANVPVAQSVAQGDNAEVHNAGEVWAAMLFEAYIALLKNTQGATPKYTFDEAHRRMTDYLEGGFKMAPTDPTYTEQRDAILATAAAADTDDLQAMAQAFAKRGAGTCAVSPPRDSQDFSGVVESFTVVPNVTVVSTKLDDSVKSCDNDGFLDAEETGKLTVEVMNTGTAPVTGATATVTSAAKGVTFPNGTKLSFGDIAPYAKATATIDVSLAATLTTQQTLDLKIAMDGVTGCTNSTYETAPLVNFDQVAMSSATDSVEAVDTVWTTSGQDADSVWSRTESKPGNHVWTGIDFPSPSDTQLVSPDLDVSPTDNFVLKFDHRHQFESSDSMGQTVNWDGAVIEISTNGSSWQDISKYGDPGYGGVIGDPQNQAMNTLKGRNGYVATSASYPGFDTVTIDMGKSLAGKTVKVRFRIGTDDAAGANGWDIDNISFTGITNKPFSALVDDKSSCGAPPIADAGPDQTVTSGQMVTLDGSKSFDPANLPLVYTWTQLAGTSASLSGAKTAQPTFVAPGVSKPTKLTFQLSVTDGKGSATDTVDVLVNPGEGTGGGGTGGNGDMVAGGGCGCFVGGDTPAAPLGAPLFALAVLLWRRRRRS
jgi:MYXO-CTERM domain-containing protein